MDRTAPAGATGCRQRQGRWLTAECAASQAAKRQLAIEQGHRQRLAEAIALVGRMVDALEGLFTPRSIDSPPARYIPR